MIADDSGGAEDDVTAASEARATPPSSDDATPTSIAPATAMRWLLALLAIALCALPHLFVHDVAFKSDDVVLTAWGAGHDLGSGLLAAFTKPFLETEFVQFYRPLYVWSFVLDARLFGDDAEPYRLVNLGWHLLALLTGFLVATRLVGARWAFLATLLFGLSPWCVNNVSWLVGRCTSVVTVFVFLTALAHLRWVRRGRRGVPLLAIGCAAIGVFWRESALFAPVLVFGIDLVEDRRDRRAIWSWLLISLPFAIYMACRHAVLGTLGGTYARFQEIVGLPDPDLLEVVLRCARTLLRILVPGHGGFEDDFGVLRLAGIAALLGLVALGFLGGVARSRAFWLFAGFALLHAIPLLAVDHDVHGGSSQRWHTPLWGFAGALALCARHARLRAASTGRRPLLDAAAVALVVVLLGSYAHRTVVFLDGYERSARTTHAIRAAIARSQQELVFFYNVTPYDGPSPNYEVGLGQLGLPPFSARGGGVYPIARGARWSEDEIAQTPIAAGLMQQGRSCVAYWCDWERGIVQPIPPELLAAPHAPLLSLRRLRPELPDDLDGIHDLLLRVDVGDLRRLDVHLVTPLAEIHVPRVRGAERHGRFEGNVWVEELGGLLETARIVTGGNDGRCWLWLAAYADDTREGGPAAVSDVIEIRVAPVRAETRASPK